MSSDEVSVVLVGDGPTAESALASLATSFRVVGVVRNVADPAAVLTDPVRRAAADLGVPAVDARTVQGVEQYVAECNPDIVVVSSFARVLPAHLVERRPFINVHYAPLPQYRGRANVNWAIINGETATAMTIHSIVPGLDAGPILVQTSVPIGGRDHVGDVYERLNQAQQAALAGAVRRRLSGDLGDPQDESRATYCCGRLPEDGRIDWASSTDTIDRLVRATSHPYPGAFTYLGGERVVIDRAHPVENPRMFVGRVPGRPVAIDRRSGTVDVLTADGILRLEAVRVEGERRRPADVITSVQVTLDGRGLPGSRGGYGA